jgi:hypothetical protein
MAVQFADKALDEWLTAEIEKAKGNKDRLHGAAWFCGYAEALEDTKDQLHALWGSALKEMPEVRKCCGTCKHWIPYSDPPYCSWDIINLPFWATISDGDHGIYTEYEDGNRCRAYEPCDVS